MSFGRGEVDLLGFACGPGMPVGGQTSELLYRSRVTASRGGESVGLGVVVGDDGC
ncbi:MAG: hypothetical protein WKF82_02070 [Nocardioidaceae bacterium]